MADDDDSKRDKSDATHGDLEKKEPVRRKVLKGGVIVSGAAVAAAFGPKKWTRPLVEAVIVPAHAATSPLAPTPSPTPMLTPSPTPMLTPSPTPSPTPGG